MFEVTQAPLASRAAFLTACVFISLGSLALVLSIFEQQAFGGGLGNWWYASTLISPLAGKFYLDNAERTDQVSTHLHFAPPCSPPSCHLPPPTPTRSLSRSSPRTTRASRMSSCR